MKKPIDYYTNIVKRTKERNRLKRLNNPSYCLLSSYKSRDKKKGYICDLTEEWIKDNILNKPCTYCGTLNHIGCDRIDNSKGHTMDNVIPSCKRCNCIRNVFFTVDEMKLIGEFIKLNIDIKC